MASSAEEWLAKLPAVTAVLRVHGGSSVLGESRLLGPPPPSPEPMVAPVTAVPTPDTVGVASTVALERPSRETVGTCHGRQVPSVRIEGETPSGEAVPLPVVTEIKSPPPTDSPTSAKPKAIPPPAPTPVIPAVGPGQSGTETIPKSVGRPRPNTGPPAKPPSRNAIRFVPAKLVAELNTTIPGPALTFSLRSATPITSVHVPPSVIRRA